MKIFKTKKFYERLRNQRTAKLSGLPEDAEKDEFIKKQIHYYQS